LIAEAVGTFILVGMGSLAIIGVGGAGEAANIVVISIGFGLGLDRQYPRLRIARRSLQGSGAAYLDL